MPANIEAILMLSVCATGAVVVLVAAHFRRQRRRGYADRIKLYGIVVDCIAEATRILNAAAADGRVLTVEEQAKIDAIEAVLKRAIADLSRIESVMRMSRGPGQRGYQPQSGPADWRLLRPPRGGSSVVEPRCRCGYHAGSGPSPTRDPAAYPVGPPGAGEPRCRRGVAKRSLVATILEDGTWET